LAPFSNVLSTPIAVSLTYWWNWGSILGVVFRRQLVTGLFLVILYTRDSFIAFTSVEYVIREVNRGWIFRVLHFNGARLFLVCLLLHIGRGLVLGSLKLWKTWTTGIILLIFVMGEAFIGYVLPWGQISV
jgi:ubiquinol-cytochrome c reductase cytochrome b subunit